MSDLRNLIFKSHARCFNLLLLYAANTIFHSWFFCKKCWYFVIHVFFKIRVFTLFIAPTHGLLREVWKMDSFRDASWERSGCRCGWKLRKSHGSGQVRFLCKLFSTKQFRVVVDSMTRRVSEKTKWVLLKKVTPCCSEDSWDYFIANSKFGATSKCE